MEVKNQWCPLSNLASGKQKDKISFVFRDNSDLSALRGITLISQERNLLFRSFLWKWKTIWSNIYRGFIFVENLVILWHGHTEDDGRNVLKTMDPFLSLGSLSAHIEELEVEVLEWKVNLYYARGLDPGPEDILFSRLVVFGSKSVKIIKETVKGTWLHIN